MCAVFGALPYTWLSIEYITHSYSKGFAMFAHTEAHWISNQDNNINSLLNKQEQRESNS